MTVGVAALKKIVVASLCLAMAACTSSSDLLTSPDPNTPFVDGKKTGGRDFAVQAGSDMPLMVEKPVFDPRHTYRLAELIDIAEMNNPTTRIAWQRAREAAAQVGISQAAYLPMLSASVLGGYAQTSSVEPGIKNGLVDIPEGVLTTKGTQVTSALTVNWLLFDFGGREASVGAAKDLTYAANVSFNGTHQTLIFDVSNAFFQLAAARIQTKVNAEALENARQVLAATEARQKSGIATSIETAQARQQTAQAQFDLTQAKGTEAQAYAALLDAMGISPTTKIKVEDISARRPPRRVPVDLDRMIEDSLRRRPDVLAAFAKAKAGEKGVDAVKAQFLPKIAVTGSYSNASGNLTVSDSRLPRSATSRFNQPNASVMLGVSIPLYDGGLRARQMDAAQSNAQASVLDMKRVQTNAAQEIVVAYNALGTGLSAYSAASELVRAAKTTYDASLDYYKQGLGTLSDVSVAQNGLLKARLSQGKALSDSFTAAASFAFASGALTSAEAVP